MELPLFQGLQQDPEVVRSAMNDLKLNLPDYNIARNGANIGIVLKGDNGIFSEDFYRVIGYSELSRLANIDIDKIEFNEKSHVRSANMRFVIRMKMHESITIW
jgi:hypothetical protein